MTHKTLIDVLKDYSALIPACPKCNLSTNIIKSGVRKIRNETIQIYFCKQCSKRFNDRKIPRTSYSPKLILQAISYFNLGHTLQETTKSMQRKYKTKVPISTLNSWIHRYENDLPFIKLRRRFKIDPNLIIKKKKLQHQQPYLFQINTLKFNIACKKFPQLRTYINSIFNDSKDYIYQMDEILRCSELAKYYNMDKPEIKHIKKNLATSITNFALTLAKTKKDRHQIIEDFFLINDSVTIANEIPVYLLKEESNFENHLTGHIDLIQIRNNKIHIIDYKPEAKNEKFAINQLFLYALALQIRTNIAPSNFECGYFDEQNYYQFTPNLK